MHPSDEIKGIKSNKLSNKRIVLGVTGSIAAVEIIKLARELIRHGAEVIPIMTKAATKIIHPDSLWFATGKKPIIDLTGETEHVKYCGQVKNSCDLLMISPCTANTLSKISHGIDDSVVTTFATTAIGSKIPILVVPAMHLSMYDHLIIQENIKKCKKNGINFIEPLIGNNKAKMASIDEIIANVFRLTTKKDYSKKKILIIGGPSAEPIDDIRIITNLSSGKTAISLAKSAFYRNAEVELWYGLGKEKKPEYINTINFSSINDVFKILNNNNNLAKFDIIILCAALSDYIPQKKQGKITSGLNNLTISMKKAPKLISIIRNKAPKSMIIGYKVEENIEHLKDECLNLLKNNKLDFVIGNTIKGFDNSFNEIWIYNKKGELFHKKANKEIIANYILDVIIESW